MRPALSPPPQMRSWGYAYIENLTWVYLRPDHSVAALPARYANASHLTLYMFRREGGCRRLAPFLMKALRLPPSACVCGGMSVWGGAGGGQLPLILLSLVPPPVELAEVHARASLRAASPTPPPPCAAGQAVSAPPARCLLHACATAAAGEGKDIELRHQRNPDVTFDCLVDPAGAPAQLACLGMGDAL
jgi:hypothetical protein